MEEAQPVRLRNYVVVEWALTLVWCLYVLRKNDLGLNYQLGACALAVAVLVYAVKTRAWTFLTLASGVAFFASFWGVLVD